MDINDFFQSITTLKENKKTTGQWENKLKLEVGNSYLIRFIPYLKEGKSGYNKTFFKHYTYCWRSIEDGKWIYVLSPRTFGERCPITDFYFKAKDSPDPAVQEKLKKLSYKQNCYYNVYVVDDAMHPENNGTVKYLQASKQLNDVIENSIVKDEAKMQENLEELGTEDLSKSMYDFSENGNNLCIEVKDQGGFPNYKSSKFVRRRRDLGLSEKDVEEIYNKAYDLTTLDKRLSTDEIEELFARTFLGIKNTGKMTSSQPVIVEEKRAAQTHVDVDESPKTIDAIDGLDELDAYLSEDN